LHTAEGCPFPIRVLPDFNLGSVARTPLVALFLPQSRFCGRIRPKAPVSGVTDHASHPGDHFLGLRRLAEKPAVVANIDGSSAGEKRFADRAETIDTRLTNKMHKMPN
jgi:hypothetical protein